MRKFIFLGLAFLLFAADVSAQKRRGGFRRKKQSYRYELIGSLGATNFLGDLGGADQIGTHGFKDLNWVATRAAGGGSVRFKLNQYLSIKNNLYFAIVNGDDALTKEPFRQNRNSNFRSPIIELSSQAEFNFVKEQKGHVYRIKGVRGMKHKDRQIYLFGGAGLIYFNPQGQWNGKWYNLAPLHTEGVSYSRFTGFVMFGGGMRFAIDRYWGIGFELGTRWTFTDYLDDVSGNYVDPKVFNGNQIAIHFADPSLHPDNGWTAPGQQRGDPKHNDAYMLAVLTVSYKVMNKRRSRSKF